MFARPTVRETVSKTDKTFLHCFENCLKLLENCLKIVFLLKQFYENCLNIVFYQKDISKQFYENCFNIVFIQNMFRTILRKLFKHCFLSKNFENNFMKIV